MLVTLEVVSGADRGARVALQPGQAAIIGRTERATIVLRGDAFVSDRHVLVECEANRCRLRDLNSTNGTNVNDQRVQTRDLQSGDLIALGKSTVSVSITGNAQPRLPELHVAQTAGGAERPSPAAPTLQRSIRERFSSEDLEPGSDEPTEFLPSQPRPHGTAFPTGA
jgi:pSer/pThr/pTyr-binding forkhead associated (FHA) protein